MRGVAHLLNTVAFVLLIRGMQAALIRKPFHRSGLDLFKHCVLCRHVLAPATGTKISVERTRKTRWKREQSCAATHVVPSLSFRLRMK